jgi:hypothetical protein
MAWYDRSSIRHNAQDQSALEKLVQLGRRQFKTTLTPAELQVLNDTVSSLDLPSPEENALRPEDNYDENAPRPEVRAAFLCWLATDLEARPCIHAKGIRVYSSTIIGDLDLSRQRQLPTLDFRRCNVTGRIVLEASETKGLNFTDCSIFKGIEADGLLAHGPVLLHRTQSQGEISFINATVEDDMEFQGAKLTINGDALSLDGATIKGDLLFNEDFVSQGEISMLRAQIDGSVEFSGATLLSEKDALTLDKVTIGGNLVLNRKLKCGGSIRLPNCHIRGDLNFMAAEICAVICYNMNLSGDLLWHGVQRTSKTDLDLRSAKVQILRDNEASWPAEGRMHLDNLIYQDLILHANPNKEQMDNGIIADPLPLRVDQRVAWLKLQPAANRLRPQPWAQLSRYLESINDKAGAKHVQYEFRRLQAHKSMWPMRCARIAFACLEETPARIMRLIIPTLLVGTLIFAGASPGRSGAMITTARDKDGQPVSGAALNHYPQFQPFIYTLENDVPLVKLGIDDKWTPDPAHGGKAWFPQYAWLNWLGWFNSYEFLTFSRYLIIFLGWFQAAVLGAALTSRFKQ